MTRAGGRAWGGRPGAHAAGPYRRPRSRRRRQDWKGAARAPNASQPVSGSRSHRQPGRIMAAAKVTMGPRPGGMRLPDQPGGVRGSGAHVSGLMPQAEQNGVPGSRSTLQLREEGGHSSRVAQRPVRRPRSDLAAETLRAGHSHLAREGSWCLTRLSQGRRRGAGATGAWCTLGREALAVLDLPSALLLLTPLVVDPGFFQGPQPGQSLILLRFKGSASRQ